MHGSRRRGSFRLEWVLLLYVTPVFICRRFCYYCCCCCFFAIHDKKKPESNTGCHGSVCIILSHNIRAHLLNSWFVYIGNLKHENVLSNRKPCMAFFVSEQCSAHRN